MDIQKMLSELREERDHIDGAILAIEQLTLGGGKRRGRPPKLVQEGAEGATELLQPNKKRRKFSPEARKRMAEAQRKRWAREKAQTA